MQVTSEVEPVPARRAAPWVAASALYWVAAVAGTWPLVLRITTDLPLGTLGNATVPLFNLWTLEWNLKSLAHGFSGYWDAPIFYPTPGTFALSEAQALTGFVFAVLRAAVSGVTAYNIVLLATLVGNGLAARRLMRVLGASNVGATATGLLAVGLPFVWKELGVLQLSVLWPVWLALSELAVLSGASGALSGVSAPSSPRTNAAALVRLALWCAAIVWTCTYYALFVSLFLLLGAALFVRRELFRPPLRVAMLLAIVVLLGSAYPLIAQQRVVGTYARSAKTIHDGGATARAYTRLPLGALGGHVLPPIAARSGRRSLFPGTILVVLAAIGVGSLVRRRVPTRFFLWCGISVVLALVLSFGARWSIGTFTPYEAIIERFVPGFGNARSPYRFAVFVQLFALVFAGLGFEVLRRSAWHGLPADRRRDWIILAAAAIGFLEVTPIPTRLERFPAEALHATWIDYLAQHPGGAVAMIPPALTGKADDFESTTVAMLQALRHEHPLLNGYSGFFPSSSDAYIDALKDFPNPRSKRLLGRVPVRYAVVDKTWLGPRPDAQLAPLTRVFDSPTHAIYLVPERPAAASSP